MILGIIQLHVTFLFSLSPWDFLLIALVWMLLWKRNYIFAKQQYLSNELAGIKSHQRLSISLLVCFMLSMWSFHSEDFRKLKKNAYGANDNAFKVTIWFLTIWTSETQKPSNILKATFKEDGKFLHFMLSINCWLSTACTADFHKLIKKKIHYHVKWQAGRNSLQRTEKEGKSLIPT